MPARQTRRTQRRRVAPPSTLPRPTADAAAIEDGTFAEPEPEETAPRTPAGLRPARRPLGVRAHHVTEDYRYIRTDLVMVAAVSAVTLAFVVGMSFFFTQ